MLNTQEVQNWILKRFIWLEISCEIIYAPFSQQQTADGRMTLYQCVAVACCVGVFNHQSDGIMVSDVKHSAALGLFDS